MRHAVMSASYKPALLKALARLCRRTDALVIHLDDIGEEFAKMYWNQVVVYHLRQAAAVTKQSAVIKLILESAEKYGARAFSDLPDVGRALIRDNMAHVLTINVLSAFHASKPDAMPVLYQWDRGDLAITLTRQSHAFIRENSSTLQVIANYHWAAFLEACNRLAPRIIQKVQRDGASRGSLTPYLRILVEDGETSCFYCEQPFTETRRPVVDHVIPWTFILEDPLWD